MPSARAARSVSRPIVTNHMRRRVAAARAEEVREAACFRQGGVRATDGDKVDLPVRPG